jgi:hypothetical protein
MIVGVKLLQYTLLTLNTLVLAGMFKDGAHAFGLSLLVILLLLNLKWMSRYPVSYGGMWYINGILSIYSAALVIKGITAASGTTSFNLVTGIAIAVAAIAPIFLWWNVNILEVMRRLARKRE